MASTRRDFLATTSRTLAGALVGSRWLDWRMLPLDVGHSASRPADFFIDPAAPQLLRALASQAIDVAKGAGASYADIRVAERYSLWMNLSNLDSINPNVRLQSTFAYGVRALVDGAWAFAHGSVPSADLVASAAREAVASARGYASIATKRVLLAPAPVAVGAWETPVRLDPFMVSMRDQAALMSAYRDAAFRVHYGSIGGFGVTFEWIKETRVFASTEGAMTTQTTMRSIPEIRVMGDVGMGFVELSLAQVRAASGGYETVAIAGLQDALKHTTEEAVQLAALPRGTLDVGRYPVVFDGISFSTALGTTVGQALEFDRVLGYEADAEGTSYLAPPDEVLGTQIANPLLNVTAHRTVPSLSAIKWDDEGVEMHPYQVIVDGQLRDYHTSRETASTLRSSSATGYRSRGSRGCAIADDADAPVLVRGAHLTVAPSPTPERLDDLCRGMTHGIVVRNANVFSTDQQLASGTLTYGGTLIEVRNGTPVRRLDGNGLQFNTRRLLKSLVALGGEGTVRHSVFQVSKGQPWRPVLQQATAPAAFFKDIDVIGTKVHL